MLVVMERTKCKGNAKIAIYLQPFSVLYLWLYFLQSLVVVQDPVEKWFCSFCLSTRFSKKFTVSTSVKIFPEFLYKNEYVFFPFNLQKYVHIHEMLEFAKELL